VLTVTAPDGTTTTPTPAVVGSTATATVVPTLAGQYLLLWTVTGAIIDAVQDQFTAAPSTLALISFGDVKDQLNIATVDTSGNARLRRFIQSATDVVQNITGPLLGQQRTEYFDGNRTTVVLMPRWVQSIVSIVETLGTTTFTLTEQPLGAGGYTQFGYTWDRSTHKITRRANGLTNRFPPGDGNVAVTYKQGISPLPQDITDATGELIRHWWAHGQEPFRGTFQAIPGDDDGGTIQVMGYAVPNRVIEMLKPYEHGPGAA
jgi:hypothetical protein